MVRLVDWLENAPKNRQFSMTLYAKVVVDNVVQSNAENLLAAFGRMKIRKRRLISNSMISLPRKSIS